MCRQFSHYLVRVLFTTLLLGHFRSGAPFQDVVLISVSLSLGAALQRSNITPGGSEARVVEKTLKFILSAVLSHLKIFYQ